MSWFCCCNCPPPIGDNFNRADSTTVADDTHPWVEYSGDWSIASNQLTQSGANNATIYWDDEIAWDSYILQTTMKAVTDQDHYLWILDFLPSDPGAASAKINFLVSTTAGIGSTFEIIYEGATTVSWEDYLPTKFVLTEGYDYHLNVCIQKGDGHSRATIAAWLDEYPVNALISCGALHQARADRRIALVDVDNRGMKWDDFSVVEQWFSNHKCVPCFCDCNGYCVPRELTVTLENTENCSEADAKEIPLVRQGSTDTWSTPASTGPVCYDIGGNPHNIDAQLVCAGDPGNPDFTLRLGSECGMGYFSPISPTILTCNPIYMVFDFSFGLATGDFFCGCCNATGPPTNYFRLRATITA